MKTTTYKYETNPISMIINGTKRAFSTSQQLTIMLIIIPFVMGMVNFVIQIFSEVFGRVIDGRSDSTSVALIVIGGTLMLSAFLLQIFVQTTYTSLQAFSVIKIMKNEDAGFNAALSEALGKFWKILGTNLLIGLYALPYVVALVALVSMNIVFGFMEANLLFITIPPSAVLGIFLFVLLVRVYLRFNFATFTLFDGAGTVSEALEKSKTLTHKRLIEVFGVRSLASVVPLINGVTVAGGEAVLYEQLKHARTHDAKLPKQSVLNYLLLFIFGGLVAIGGFFTLLILLAVHAS